MKIVWVCHFSNKEVREFLPVYKNRLLYRLIKWIQSKPAKNVKSNDFAPWITTWIREFEKFEDIELHIVSPQTGLKGGMKCFKIKNINYCFYPVDFTLFLATLIKDVNLWIRIQRSSKYVKKYIEKVNPDIINLIGAENYYHSCSILDIHNIPIFVSCQTIYTNPERLNFNPVANKTKNWLIEKRIHQKEFYFGCQGRMHRDLLLQNNSNVIVFKLLFPFCYPKVIHELEKRYDFVCFAAKHLPEKGTEDAIKALYIAKKIYKHITLNIVGYCDDQYKQFLLNLSEELGIKDSIIYNAYFSRQEEVYQQISLSKYALLPVKMDVIPSTILESMALDLPVITYQTTGTPYVNKFGNAILIAQLGDIQDLADKMILLLSNESLSRELIGNAKFFLKKERNNAENAKRVLSSYYAIVDHFKTGKPISDELLFSLEEFPIY
jgi:glycosyltransferase involved in cell wall biosynthesis